MTTISQTSTNRSFMESMAFKVSMFNAQRALNKADESESTTSGVEGKAFYANNTSAWLILTFATICSVIFWSVSVTNNHELSPSLYIACITYSIAAIVSFIRIFSRKSRK